MADPSANVFNGKLYIYPSHDWESGIPENDNGDHFNMKDYHVFVVDDPESGEAATWVASSLPKTSPGLADSFGTTTLWRRTASTI